MLRHCSLLALLIAFLTFGHVCRAEETAVDLTKFGQELQRSESDGKTFRLIWWIPTEYWHEAFRKSPLTPEQRTQFQQALDDYFVVGIIDGEIQPFGLKAHPAEKIRENVSLQIGNEDPLLPLAQEDVSDEAQSILTVMKPMFGKMLGDFGKGMELVLFPGKDANRKRFVTPREQGQFRLKFSGKDYSWRLPLGCLLPPKYDTKSGEQFPGNYEFSPFTGDRLTNEKPTTASR